MPTYEYECEKCGHRFEKLQKMSDSPVESCPACKGGVHRLISAGGGVIIKDGGSHDARPKTRCGKEHTCCGQETPCEQPPCGD